MPAPSPRSRSSGSSPGVGTIWSGSTSTGSAAPDLAQGPQAARGRAASDSDRSTRSDAAIPTRLPAASATPSRPAPSSGPRCASCAASTPRARSGTWCCSWRTSRSRCRCAARSAPSCWPRRPGSGCASCATPSRRARCSERALSLVPEHAGGARGSGARLRSRGAAARSRGGLGAPGGALARRPSAQRRSPRRRRSARGRSASPSAPPSSTGARSPTTPAARPPPTDSPRFARESGQWSLLASLLEGRFETAGEPAQRAEIAIESARLQLEKLASPERARSWWLRALGQAPEDPRVVDGLAEVARALGDDTELLRCLERRAEISGDADAGVGAAGSRFAALGSGRGRHRRRAARTRAAAGARRRAGGRGPLRHAHAARPRRGSGRPARAPGGARGRAMPARARPCFAELGALQEERLGDPEAAALAYERAFDADPDAPGVAAALDRLHRKAEDLDVAAPAARARPRRRAGGAARRLRVRARRPAGGAAGAAGRGGARLRGARWSSIPRAPAAHRGLRRLAAERGDSEALLRIAEDEIAVTSDRTRIAELARELVGGCEAARAARARARLGAALGRDRPREPRAVRGVGPAARGARPRRGAGDLPGATSAPAAGKRARCESATAGPPPRRAGPRGRQHPVSRVGARVGSERSRVAGGARRAARARRTDRGAGARAPLARRRRAAGAARGLPRCAGASARGARRRPRRRDRGAHQLTASQGAPADAGARLEKLLEQAGRYDELAAHLREARRGLRGRQPRGVARSICAGRGSCWIRSGAAPRRPRSTARCWRSTADPSEARDGLETALRAAGDLAGLAERLEARAAYEADPQAAGPARPRAGDTARTAPRRTGRRAAGARAGAGVLAADTHLRHGPRAAGEPARADRRRLRAARPARGIALRRRAGARRRAPRTARPALPRPSRGPAPPRSITSRPPRGCFPGAPKPGARSPISTPRPGAAASCSQTLEAELATGPDREREIGLRSRAAALLADATDGAERVPPPLGARARAGPAPTSRQPTT